MTLDYPLTYSDITRYDGDFFHRHYHYTIDCREGPAVDDKLFTLYIVNGKYHNLDGPAYYDKRDGSGCFCIKGVFYPFNDWCIELRKTDEEITFLKLKYGGLTLAG